MYKKIILIGVLLFFYLLPIAYAEVRDPLITPEYVEELENDPEKKPSYGERFLSNILLGPINVLIDIIGAKDVSYLVFQREELAPILGKEGIVNDGFSGSRQDYILGIFPEKYFDGIAAFYDTFQRLLPIPVLMLMTLAGLLLFFSVHSNGDTRNRYKDYLLGLIYLILAFRWGSLVWEFVFNINYFVVDLVWGVLKSFGVPAGAFLNTIWGNQLEEMLFLESFGLAIIVFIAFFMTFVLNYQYTLRMIIISVLILLFPIVILGLIFPTRRQNLNLWFHEFTTQVFMQASHALALGLFFYMRYALEDLSFWIICAFIFGLPTVAALVTRIVSVFTGVQGGGGISGGFGAMMGLTALMNLAKLAKSSASNKGLDGLGNTTGSSSDGKNDEGVVSRLGNAINGNGQGRGKGKIPLSNGKSSEALGFKAGLSKEQAAEKLANLKKMGKSALSSAKKPAMVMAGSMVGGALSAMATGNVAPGLTAGGLVGDSIANRLDKSIENENDVNDEVPIEPDGALTTMLNNHYNKTRDEYNNENEKLKGIDKNKNPELYNAQKQLVDGKRSAMNKAKSALDLATFGTGESPIAIPQKMKQQANNAQLLANQAKSRLNSLASGTPEYMQQEMAVSQMEAIHGQMQEITNDISNSPSATGMLQNIAKASANYNNATNTLRSIDKQASPEQYEQQVAIVRQAKTALDQTQALASQNYPSLSDSANKQLTTKYQNAVTVLQKEKATLQSINRTNDPDVYQQQQQVVQYRQQQLVEIERKVNQTIQRIGGNSNTVSLPIQAPPAAPQTIRESIDVIHQVQQQYETARQELSTINMAQNPVEYVQKRQEVVQSQNIVKQTENIVFQQHSALKQSPQVITKYVEAKNQIGQAQHILKNIDANVDPVAYETQMKVIEQSQNILDDIEYRINQLQNKQLQEQKMKTLFNELKSKKRSKGSL